MESHNILAQLRFKSLTHKCPEMPLSQRIQLIQLKYGFKIISEIQDDVRYLDSWLESMELRLPPLPAASVTSPAWMASSSKKDIAARMKELKVSSNGCKNLVFLSSLYGSSDDIDWSAFCSPNQSCITFWEPEGAGSLKQHRFLKYSSIPCPFVCTQSWDFTLLEHFIWWGVVTGQHKPKNFFTYSTSNWIPC